MEIATIRPAAERLELWVANEGSRIAPEDRERIFRPFESVEQGLSRAHGGAGLGLALVKHLVERHAGTVRVEDHREDGTRFVVDLPWHPGERGGRRDDGPRVGMSEIGGAHGG